MRPTYQIRLHLPVHQRHEGLLFLLNSALMYHRTMMPNYERVHLMFGLMDIEIKAYPPTSANLELHANWAITVNEYLNVEYRELDYPVLVGNLIMAKARFDALVLLLLGGPWTPGCTIRLVEASPTSILEAVRADFAKDTSEAVATQASYSSASLSESAVVTPDFSNYGSGPYSRSYAPPTPSDSGSNVSQYGTAPYSPNTTQHSQSGVSNNSSTAVSEAGSVDSVTTVIRHA